MLHDILHGIHDLSDTGLVVCSQKSGSVSCDDGLTFIIKELRELAWLEAESRYALQRNLAAVIVLDDLWLHVVAWCIRCSVGVSDETDSRHLFVTV